MHPGDTKGDTKLSTVFVSTQLAFENNLRLQLSDEIFDLRLALFIRCLGFLFAEFLEARIVAQRIKHGIESEQRGSEWHV
jgi:hypothetical protein